MNRTILSLCILSLLAACSSRDEVSSSGPFPLGLSSVTVQPAQDRAILSWSTTRTATGVVRWGTADNLAKSLPLLEAGTQHQAVLTGLVPGAEYAFLVEAHGVDGAVISSAVQLFHAAAPLPFAADDFDAANLDGSRWCLVDPTGAGELRMVGSGTADAHLELEVPVGVESLPWTDGNHALRVVQKIPAGNWNLQVKFEGALGSEGTGHGLLIEVDDDTFMRFDFAFNSNKAQVFAALLDAGTVVDTFSDPLLGGAWEEGTLRWMRVSRLGHMYTQEWSTDGTTWHAGAQFTLAEEPVRVGLHAIAAGNWHGGHVVRADYLINSNDPFPGEDTVPGADHQAPLIYLADAIHVGDEQIRLRWWTDEPATARLRYGEDTSYSAGTLLIQDDLYEHEVLVEGLAADTTYHFQILSRDDGDREIASNDLEATTNPPGVTGIPALNLWYGDAQPNGAWEMSFGQLGNPQHQVNVLGNVTDDDEDSLVDALSLYYQFNGGTWKTLALGDDRSVNYQPWRLANEGDFNLELEVEELTLVPLVDGVHRNEVTFEVLDDDGHATYLTVHVDYTPDVTWTPNTSVDWDTVERVTDAVQVVDGDWRIDDHPSLGRGLRLRPGAHGYDRLVAIGEGHGDDAWEDYQVTVAGTVLGFDELGWTEGTNSYAMGLALRWSGHNQGWGPNQPSHDIYPFGGIFVCRWFETFERWELWINKDGTVLPFDAPVSVGTTYLFKSRCETQPAGGTRYRLKRWDQSQAEPEAWDFDYTTPADQDHPEGSLMLISHHVDVLFGDIVVTEL
jgi:hypothetical protein